MKYELPKRFEKFSPYKPLEGEYKYRFDANESPFGLTKEDVKNYANNLDVVDFNRYPDAAATEVIKAFAAMYGLKEEYIVAGNGSDEIIALIMSSFFEKEQTVAVFDNDFSMYGIYAEIYGVDCKKIPKNKDLTIDVDVAIKYIKENYISAVIFSNPGNPTSLGLCKADVQKLIKSTDALVILDEAYMDFWDQSLLSEHEDYENLIILKTCSKALGLASIRLGFAISNIKIITALKSVKSPYNLNTLTQTVAVDMLSKVEKVKEIAEKMVMLTQKLRADFDVLKEKYGLFDEVYDSKTNFIYVKTAYATEIYTALLNDSIAVRNFKEYLRISTGTEVENRVLLECVEKILAKIK